MKLRRIPVAGDFMCNHVTGWVVRIIDGSEEGYHHYRLETVKGVVFSSSLGLDYRRATLLEVLNFRLKRKC